MLRRNPQRRSGSHRAHGLGCERQESVALNKAKAYLARRKIKADVEVRIGAPAQSIVDYAKKKKCTQIVMGNRGQGALAGFFLGSVAMKVVQLSDVPVTLVK